jgi:hypothetical protein
MSQDSAQDSGLFCVEVRSKTKKDVVSFSREPLEGRGRISCMFTHSSMQTALPLVAAHKCLLHECLADGQLWEM